MGTEILPYLSLTIRDEGGELTCESWSCCTSGGGAKTGSNPQYRMADFSSAQLFQLLCQYTNEHGNEVLMQAEQIVEIWHGKF